MSNMTGEQQPSGFERQRLSKGKLLALIIVLWLPLPIIGISVLAWAGVSLPLLAVIAVGTIFSLGLALGALRVRT